MSLRLVPNLPERILKMAARMEHTCGGCECEHCVRVANEQKPWEFRRDTIVCLGLEAEYK